MKCLTDEEDVTEIMGVMVLGCGEEWIAEDERDVEDIAMSTTTKIIQLIKQARDVRKDRIRVELEVVGERVHG